MGLIVQKFGGTSVADAERLRNVARIITETRQTGNQVVAVLSAQGKTTDELMEKAREINPKASRREMDMLLSTGEQISCALCAMAIEAMGCPVVSLTGWQAGVQTDDSYSNARIKRIETERIRAELDRNNAIVIVTGFQGINRRGDITTLGRGGSDTSAVALAAALKADLCQIYTDVEGIYTADPRQVKGAGKLKELTYDEMLELADAGAQVLHNRSVELAGKYRVSLEVLSSFADKPGTRVGETTEQMEKPRLIGVAKDTDVAQLSLVGGADRPGIACRVFSLLGKEGIHVDLLFQALGRDGRQDISFTVKKSDADRTRESLEERGESLGCRQVEVNPRVAKLSLVGADMVDSAGVAAGMLEALCNADINILMVSAGESKVTVLVDESVADRAMQTIHDRFFSE